MVNSNGVRCLINFWPARDEKNKKKRNEPKQRKGRKMRCWREVKEN